jgi:hypothetical protein
VTDTIEVSKPHAGLMISAHHAGAQLIKRRDIDQTQPNTAAATLREYTAGHSKIKMFLS